MNEDLLKKLLADEATAADLRELAVQARRDKTARTAYIRAMEFEALLSIALENQIERAESAMKILEAVDAADSRDFVGEFRQRVRRRRHFGIAAAAALILAGTFLWVRTTEVIATVTRMDRVIQGSERESFMEGTGIKRGTFIDLDEGLVEVSLQEGDKIIIEGPARVEFTGRSGMRLQQGRIAGHFSPSGYGYRIETPEGSVEVRGPLVGIAVGERERTEAHALEGNVMVTLRSGKKRMVKAPDALHLTDQSTFFASAEQFSTDISEEISKRQMIHWPLDEGSGRTAAARVEGTVPGEDLDFHLQQLDQGGLPLWVPGAAGSALGFDGKGAFAESPYAGVGGKRPRTVCAWVKVPKDLDPKESYAIISWGSHTEEKAWQISIQPMAEEGSLGRIRIGTFKGAWVGTTDLRDDRWHHLAVVLKKSESPDVSSDLMVYVDGTREAASYLMGGLMSTSTVPDGHGVWLGRNLERKNPETFSPISNFFRGAIDEVYIFNYPLQPGEIHRIMAAGRPHPR